MKRLTVTRQLDLDRLYQELEAALPELRPVKLHPDDRLPTARYIVEFDAEGAVTISVPDAVDLLQIIPIIENHDPTPPGPVPTPRETLVAALEAASSLGEVRQALLDYYRETA